MTQVNAFPTCTEQLAFAEHMNAAIDLCTCFKHLPALASSIKVSQTNLPDLGTHMAGPDMLLMLLQFL